MLRVKTSKPSQSLTEEQTALATGIAQRILDERKWAMVVHRRSVFQPPTVFVVLALAIIGFYASVRRPVRRRQRRDVGPSSRRGALHAR